MLHFVDRFLEIFSTIQKNKLRTVLTGFSVAWGIFMLILLLGSRTGLENGVKNEFRNVATNRIHAYMFTIGNANVDEGRAMEKSVRAKMALRHTFSPDDPKAIRIFNTVERKAVALLADRHQVSPDDAPAFGRYNTEKEYNQMLDLFAGINFLTWFVGTFTLIAGVIGVSNIMLIVVRERTKEIGIRRAIGATPFGIVGQIVLESILLTTFAGYFGLVAAIGAVEFVSTALKGTGSRTEFFKNPEVDLTIALIALGILILSGALAGLIPGKRAIGVRPVEAIRTE